MKSRFCPLSLFGDSNWKNITSLFLYQHLGHHLAQRFPFVFCLHIYLTCASKIIYSLLILFFVNTIKSSLLHISFIFICSHSFNFCWRSIVLLTFTILGVWYSTLYRCKDSSLILENFLSLHFVFWNSIIQRLVRLSFLSALIYTEMFHWGLEIFSLLIGTGFIFYGFS